MKSKDAIRWSVGEKSPKTDVSGTRVLCATNGEGAVCLNARLHLQGHLLHHAQHHDDKKQALPGNVCTKAELVDQSQFNFTAYRG